MDYKWPVSACLYIAGLDSDTSALPLLIMEIKPLDFFLASHACAIYSFRNSFFTYKLEEENLESSISSLGDVIKLGFLHYFISNNRTR